MVPEHLVERQVREVLPARGVPGFFPSRLGFFLLSITLFSCAPLVAFELEFAKMAVRFSGLSGFPNAETLNLTMSYVDVGLIGHRVQTRKGPV